MSEMINNREFRQKVLKEIIRELHDGKTVEEVKPRFEELIKGVSVNEITEMEQALIMEGMPVAEVQRLCDVHASVFKGSIEDIHKEPETAKEAGHPIQIFKQENSEIESLIQGRLTPLLEKLKTSDDKDTISELLEGFKLLLEVDKHYSRKENLLFPYLEKYGITAPPKVMWELTMRSVRPLRRPYGCWKTTEARKRPCLKRPMRLYTRPKKWFSKKKIFCSPWLWIPFPKMSGRRSMKKAMRLDIV